MVRFSVDDDDAVVVVVVAVEINGEVVVDDDVVDDINVDWHELNYYYLLSIVDHIALVAYHNSSFLMVTCSFVRQQPRMNEAMHAMEENYYFQSLQHFLHHRVQNQLK
jgi:hypothetical protein